MDQPGSRRWRRRFLALTTGLGPTAVEALCDWEFGIADSRPAVRWMSNEPNFARRGRSTPGNPKLQIRKVSGGRRMSVNVTNKANLPRTPHRWGGSKPGNPKPQFLNPTGNGGWWARPTPQNLGLGAATRARQTKPICPGCRPPGPDSRDPYARQGDPRNVKESQFRRFSG